MDFKSYIRVIKDFPKEGILFKDITPLLKDATALKAATNALLELVGSVEIDKVVGMESRGFLFAPSLAIALNAGFVPVRKAGKLPAETLSESYSLEYGEAILEIHADSIQKGDRVLIHDDVLATGGTANAVCKLIQGMGGEIVQCNFLVELDFLQGRNILNDFQVKSLLQY